MKSIKNMKNDENAVSPIVATLVLIVVAVVGAVAVGTIMGTFSSDVAKENNAGDVASASSTEIITAGSTTVLPASELLAKAYMEKHPGLKITVQGGGSGAGINAVATNIVDIGAASKHIPSDTLTTYPDLKEWQIGASAVVFITNEAGHALLSDVNSTDLAAAYVATIDGVAPIGSDDFTFYQRDEASGTEDTAAEYLSVENGDEKSADWINDETSAIKKTGNAGVRDAVKGADDPAIGFVDYGYAKDVDGVFILSINAEEADDDNIIASIKGADDAYPTKLTRPLVYITNGEPNSVVKNFIQWAQSPEGGEQISAAGMFSNAALA